MSRFWPHTPYAEDQPLSHTILYTHVLTRAMTVGSLAGAGIGVSLPLLRALNVLKPRIPPLPLATTLLRSVGVGSVVATGILAVGLPARMWGREEIEWQDRSWRLLENKGQVAVDDWTYSGMALGLGAAIARGKGLGLRGVAGSVGAGSIAGMLGYMGSGYLTGKGQKKETEP
jgi:hypothetical protein